MVRSSVSLHHILFSFSTPEKKERKKYLFQSLDETLCFRSLKAQASWGSLVHLLMRAHLGPRCFHRTGPEAQDCKSNWGLHFLPTLPFFLNIGVFLWFITTIFIVENCYKKYLSSIILCSPPQIPFLSYKFYFPVFSHISLILLFSLFISWVFHMRKKCSCMEYNFPLFILNLCGFEGQGASLSGKIRLYFVFWFNPVIVSFNWEVQTINVECYF